MREYHVRICERLGVKFPGPTRQKRTTQIPNEGLFVRLLVLRKPTNVLALSELPWFSAQTLRCPPLLREAAALRKDLAARD